MSERLKALEKFRDLVVAEAKANLKKMGKDTSGKLSSSIKGEVKAMPNSIGIYFEMEPYGNFQDKGVKGANPTGLPSSSKNYGKQNAPNSPYKFGSGSGPKGGLTRSLDSWMVRKGIAPRNVSGQFQSRKGLRFIIARSIYMTGIKPSLFFTKPFEAAYKTLPDTLIDKYGLDAEQLLNEILDQNLKNIK